MVSVGCLFLLFICQATTVRPNGISLPITSFSCKSTPTEQRTLKSVPHTTTVAKTDGADYLPKTCLESVTDNISQSRSPQIKVPLNVVALPAPALPKLDINPNLHTIASPLQTHDLNPNIAMTTMVDPSKIVDPNIIHTPQISSLPRNSLSNTEKIVVNNDLVKTPPVAISAPSYFITDKDLTHGINKIPLTPVYFDSIPSNVYKIKINDAKPIFIDCSKSSSYTNPSRACSPTEIKVKSIDSINNTPVNQFVSNVVERKPIIQTKETCVNSQTSLSGKIEEKPLTSFIIKEPTRQISNSKLNNYMEIMKSEDPNKVVHPEIFNYGSKIMNSNIISNTNKKDWSNNPAKTILVDDKIGLSITPTVNFHPPAPQPSQCDPRSIDYNNNNDVKLPLAYYYGQESLVLPKISQAYTSVNEPKVSISQMENVNSNSKILPSFLKTSPICVSEIPNVYTSTKVVPTPIINILPDVQAGCKSSKNTSISRLSGSLNGIISNLSTRILSKLFDKTTLPLEIDSPLLEPLDVFSREDLNFIEFDDLIDRKGPNEKNNYLLHSEARIESFASNPNPSIVLPQSLARPLESTSSATGNKKRSYSKPYLSSVTVNVLPNELSNDIIIVI